MSFKTTEDELRDAFGQFGSVTDVYVAMDKMTGRPRGFAFVTMGSPEEAKLAAEKMNGVDLGGRALTVNEARPKEEGGGRGFGGTARCSARSRGRWARCSRIDRGTGSEPTSSTVARTPSRSGLGPVVRSGTSRPSPAVAEASGLRSSAILAPPESPRRPSEARHDGPRGASGPGRSAARSPAC